MLIISILIDIVLNPILIVKRLFFCYDKFIFGRRANEIGTASNASEKSENGKERAGRNSHQTPLPPRPKNKIGVAKRGAELIEHFPFKKVRASFGNCELRLTKNIK